MCAVQRPLDTKNQVRMLVEAEAVLGIITLCESGAIELISSEALSFEVGRNPNPTRKRYAAEVLSLARTFIKINEAVESRANALNAINVPTKSKRGAPHLACLAADILKPRGLPA